MRSHLPVRGPRSGCTRVPPSAWSASSLSVSPNEYLAISNSLSLLPLPQLRHHDGCQRVRWRQQSVCREMVGSSRHVSLPRTGHVGGGAIVLFDLHITGGDGKATAAAACRRASGGKEGEGASIGQALDSAIIPPALPHSLPPRPPLFRDRAGDEESGDSVYGGRPSHALPCRGLAGNI